MRCGDTFRLVLEWTADYTGALGRGHGLLRRHDDWGWRMQFVKFGDEYVAATKIVRVCFRTEKETVASAPDPFKHEPQRKDKDVAFADVTIEGRGSDLRVRGEAALEALRSFCEREIIAIC